jgi:hypothetical protein
LRAAGVSVTAHGLARAAVRLSMLLDMEPDSAKFSTGIAQLRLALESVTGAGSAVPRSPAAPVAPKGDAVDELQARRDRPIA